MTLAWLDLISPRRHCFSPFPYRQTKLKGLGTFCTDAASLHVAIYNGFGASYHQILTLNGKYGLQSPQGLTMMKGIYSRPLGRSFIRRTSIRHHHYTSKLSETSNYPQSVNSGWRLTVISRAIYQVTSSGYPRCTPKMSMSRPAHALW